MRALMTTLALGTAVTATVGLAAPAQAASVRKLSCTSREGDVGTLRLYYQGSLRTITKVTYQMKLARGAATNKNNANFRDSGIAPAKTYDSPDTLIADNRERGLTGGYRRGSGGFGVKFIFDIRGDDDHYCTQSASF